MWPGYGVPGPLRDTVINAIVVNDYSNTLSALGLGVIEMTIPEKPNSRLQKYRLTGEGRKILGSSTAQVTTQVWKRDDVGGRAERSKKE